MKIIDFGLSKDFTRECLKTKVGTPLYYAPEILTSEGTYTEKCDIWSIGIILYNILTGDYPFGIDLK